MIDFFFGWIDGASFVAGAACLMTTLVFMAMRREKKLEEKKK
jgi:hypothetical protein